MTSAPADGASFTSHYEALRTWSLAPSQSVTRPAGLILVLRRGLPDWLTASSTWLPAARETASGIASDTTSMAGDPAVTMVLANMVERCQQEQAR